MKRTLVVNISEKDRDGIKMISPGDIFPSPLNTFEPTDIPELAENIRALGLLAPLSVAGPDGDGRYEILSGERRYRAISLLNEEQDEPFMAEIPCYVVGLHDMGDTQKSLAIEISNLESRDDYNREAHRFAVIKLLKKLADEGTVDEKHIVSVLRKSLKLSRRYSVMYMTVFRDGIQELIDSVQSDLKEPDGEGGPVHIPVSLASRIAKFSVEGQKEATGRISRGEDANAVIDEIRRREAPPLEKPSSSGTGGMEGLAGGAAGTGNGDTLTGRTSHGRRDDPLSGYMDEDDDDMSWLEDAALNGDGFGDDFNAIDYLRSNSDDLDLSVDTTGELSRMKAGAEGSLAGEERRQVSRWIRRIRGCLERQEALEREDAELIRKFMELCPLIPDESGNP